jgi:hypothetical protein
MLISTRSVLRCFVENEEGIVGKLEDLLFDDESWAVRYVVIEIGGWIYQHQVLLPPALIDVVDWPNRSIRTRLSYHELEEAPNVSEHRPISRNASSHVQYPVGPSACTFSTLTIPIVVPVHDEPGEAHLQSTQDVIGYVVESSDGEIGHLAEMILNAPTGHKGSWTFDNLVVDRGFWFPNRKIVLAPQQVGKIHCDARAIRLAMTLEEVQASPAFQPHAAKNHRIERVFYDYYGNRRGTTVP